MYPDLMSSTSTRLAKNERRVGICVVLQQKKLGGRCFTAFFGGHHVHQTEFRAQCAKWHDAFYRIGCELSLNDRKIKLNVGIVNCRPGSQNRNKLLIRLDRGFVLTSPKQFRNSWRTLIFRKSFDRYDVWHATVPSHSSWRGYLERCWNGICSLNG